MENSLTLTQAAQRLKCSRRHLKKLIASGAVTAEGGKGKYSIYESDLDRLNQPQENYFFVGVMGTTTCNS